MPFEMLGFSLAKLETRHHDKELLHKIFASLLNHNHPPMKVLLCVDIANSSAPTLNADDFAISK